MAFNKGIIIDVTTKPEMGSSKVESPIQQCHVQVYKRDPDSLPHQTLAFYVCG